MATLSKTVQTTVLPLQSVASNAVVKSADLDVSTKFAVAIYVHFGRRATNALTTGMIFRVEAAATTAGDGHWFPVQVYQTAIAASESEAVSGTVSIGATVITVASTTNLTAGDLIYIDNGTIANSEWHRIKSISSNVSVTIEDALVNAQTGATLYDQAEIPPPFVIDCTPYKRLRLVADGSGTGQAVAVEAWMTSGDSLA